MTATKLLDRYYSCTDNNAALFLKHDYADTKDLATAFLTLLTAVLVASITFWEKIVDVRRSDWWTKGSMIACWILLFAAIASTGSSLAVMSRAAADATYWSHSKFRWFEARSVGLLKTAGVLFGSGLMALLLAAVFSLTERHDSEVRPQGPAPPLP